ncbi:MAG: DUF882 domain-containing protein [Myxococcales bacterium]|nr:DUF882 domain-containing protein [Myxococcales bacterium]
MRVSSRSLFAAVFAWFLSVCLLCLATGTAHAESNSKHPIVHRVQAGQTLGMISHRWHIPVSGLCTANGISRKRPIHPGQELIVPARDDQDGKQAAKLRRRGFLDDETRPKLLDELEQAEKAERAKAQRAKKAERAKAQRAKKAERAKAQRAEKAERAKQRRSKLARKDRRSGKTQRSRASSSSRAKATRGKSTRHHGKRSGYVRIKGLMGSWEGYAIDRKGNVTSAAKRGFRKVLRSWRTGAASDIEPRLIHMVADVSDHFGGKQILVVSGYRPVRKTQFTPHSRHNFGQAMDFHIQGVSNEELRDYARKFSKAGVGYYPNSSFIHLDAREYRTYWIDYSGPGERPRYAHQGYTGRKGKADEQPEKQEPTPPSEPEASKADTQKSDPEKPEAQKSGEAKVARSDG